jgi:hypothetical protein
MRQAARLALALALPVILAGAPACTASERDGAVLDDDDTAYGAGAMGSASEFQRWAPIMLAAGATPNPNGLVTVLGIRGRSLDGTLHDASARQVYDDTFVVLRPNGLAFALAGSTHPFQTRGVAGVPDVNGDGVRDVGRIRPGQYLAVGRGKDRPVGGLPAYDVVTFGERRGRVPGVRDTNQDGAWDAAEDEASSARADGLTGVLFHHGDRGAPAVVGCQVLSAADMTSFVKAVGGPAARFHYVLVSADAVPASSESPPPGTPRTPADG